MKIFTFVLTCLLMLYPDAHALTNIDGIKIFNKYQTYANNYDSRLLDLYSPDVKIIREVIKPDGEKVKINIPSKRFFQELKIGQKTARLRKYKNKYKNITAQEIPNGIKITAIRQPINENYWLEMYQILKQTDSGYKITEEMMQTKVQAFLKAK